MARARRVSDARRSLKVVWTDCALRDLERIDDFISANDPAASARWIDKLVAAGESAAAIPLAGRVVPEIGRVDVREVLLKRYRIVYRVQEERIEVLTVFEGHKLFPENAMLEP